jgi:hypothetical protein
MNPLNSIRLDLIRLDKQFYPQFPVFVHIVAANSLSKTHGKGMIQVIG